MTLEFWLIEKIIVSPTKGPRGTDRAHVSNYTTVCPDVQMAIGFCHIWFNSLDHTGGLKKPHHFMIDVHRAGLRIVRDLLFNHNHFQSLTA
jgi:glycosidase